MQQIAIYDMDKTITRWPTWTPFLLYAALHNAPWRLILLPITGLLVLGYMLGTIDRTRLKELTQAVMLGRSISRSRARDIAQRFAGIVIKRGLYRQARAQMAADRAAGCRIVLATASYRFYVSEITARLGIDDVIATDSVYTQNDELTARISGENCYGSAKLRMIQAWMAAHQLHREDITVRFYSDHVSDKPSLAWADHAIAVNPHPPLRALAADRGWQVLDWSQ
jgi:HAD superfamily hydrolase (TIGR01490 family)